MPNVRRLLVLSFAVLAACGRGGPIAPSPVRPAEPAPAPADSPAVPPRPRNRLAPPAVAFQLGLMPLSSTGASGWRLQHPTWDGRGVLIAILDAGVDPGIAGLGTTPQGEPKILDLRDFSDEGLVPLRAGPGGAWTGVLREIGFGDLPQADLNGDGDNRDTFRIAVARDAGGGGGAGRRAWTSTATAHSTTRPGCATTWCGGRPSPSRRAGCRAGAGP